MTTKVALLLLIVPIVAAAIAFNSSEPKPVTKPPMYFEYDTLEVSGQCFVVVKTYHGVGIAPLTCKE